MNIALIGPRGVGKSKISRKLSKLTGFSVVSTDMIAVYELGGISISDYIKKTGGDWKSFRDLEFRILQKLEFSENIILDCGGGILFDLNENQREILSDRKTNLIKKIGTVIGLNQKISYLKEKVQGDSTRPSLGGGEDYESILRRRLPYYKSVSDHYLDIDDMEIEKVAKWIMELTS